MEYVDINDCENDYNELQAEFDKLKTQHAAYLKHMEGTLSSQAKCLSSINHHRYRLSQMIPGLKRFVEFLILDIFDH